MADAARYLDSLPEQRARSELLRCCGSARWVDGMLQRRPFASLTQLHAAASELWEHLDEPDVLEAFSAHPQIGASLEDLRKKFADSAAWSSAEQASVQGASDELLGELRDKNRAYRARFGFIFIVCATGKSAHEMLALLTERLRNSREEEVLIAAGEQAKITQLRLEKLGP